MRPTPLAQASSEKVRVPLTPVEVPWMASRGASTVKRARAEGFCSVQTRGSPAAPQREEKCEGEERFHRTSTSTRVPVSRSTSVGPLARAGKVPSSMSPPHTAVRSPSAFTTVSPRL